MTAITHSNYFDTVKKYGVSNLPEALKQGHELVDDATEHGKAWKTGVDEIDEVIELQLSKFGEYVNKNPMKSDITTPKASASSGKAKSHRSPSRKAVAPSRKTKTAAKTKPAVPPKKAAGPGKAKSKKPAAKKPVKKAPARTAKKLEKQPVTKVKRMSVELTTIKSFIALNGKKATANSIVSRYRRLKKMFDDGKIRDHKSILKEILDRYEKGKAIIEGQGAENLDINISKELVAKCRMEIENAQVKLRVDYLAGTGKRKKTKRLSGTKGKVYIVTVPKDLSEGYKNPRFDVHEDEIPEFTAVALNDGTDESDWQDIDAAIAELEEMGFTFKEENTGKKPLGTVNAQNIERPKNSDYEVTLLGKNESAGKRKAPLALGKVSSASEVLNAHYTSIYIGPYVQYFGNVASNFELMVHGQGGAGKTFFLLKFANWLADNIGRVIYISEEEYGARTLKDKIEETGANSSNLFFSDSFDGVDLNQYDFVFVDSITSLEISYRQYLAMKAKYPHIAWVMIMQKTKSGKFKGDKRFEHKAQIAAEFTRKKGEDGDDIRFLDVYKNRYGVMDTLEV